MEIQTIYLTSTKSKQDVTRCLEHAENKDHVLVWCMYVVQEDKDMRSLNHGYDRNEILQWTVPNLYDI